MSVSVKSISNPVTQGLDQFTNLVKLVTQSTQLIWHIKQIPLSPRVLNQLAISLNTQPHSIWYERF